MRDVYPTEDELERVTSWPYDDFMGWMGYVKTIWWMPEWGWSEGRGVFQISTGGWSGNESIIAAMQRNSALWSCHWWLHRTGGHYEFRTRAAQELEAFS